MAKIYGSLTPNKEKTGKQPDFRGRAKLGGGERDEEHASFLRNLSLEFKEKGVNTDELEKILEKAEKEVGK